MTDIYYRVRAMDEAAKPAEDGKINMLASTDDAVDFGGYREILVHGASNIDYSAARSLLINHKPDLLAGSISGMSADGRQMISAANIDGDATMPSGVNVRKAVANGMLRGVSIGYTYSNKDAVYDEETRTITVKKWRLLEISLTPIPADGKAQIRSLPEAFNSAVTAANDKGTRSMSDDTKPQDHSADDKNEAVRAQAIADARNEAQVAKAREADVIRITKLAEAHGLRGSDFLDAAKYPTLDIAIDAMTKAKAERDASNVAARVSVVADAGDKADAAATGSILALYNAGSEADMKGSERAGSTLDIIRRHAQRHGHDSVGWSKAELSGYALAMRVPGSRSVNVTTSNFNTVVLANIMDKAVFKGFSDAGALVSYPQWTGRRSVVDFKSFSSGALDSGNLVETSEGIAFPELIKAEGSYSASLGLWGCTVNLSYQALVNDDLGEFMKMLNRAGSIAQRTIDKKVYAVVNAATWTDNTNSVTGLATAGDLDTVRKSFEKKAGPGGEVMGNKPKYLLVPSCLRTPALQATIQVQGSTAFVTNTDLIPIVTPHLTEDATPAQSIFYLAGDPNFVDTVTVSFLQGAESPQVVEYDAGAVAARKWKVMQAFVAALATTTSAGTVYIPGMQQGA